DGPANTLNCAPGNADTCRFRDAIAAVNGGGASGTTITFAPAVFATARTITLDPAQGQLTLNLPVTITGPGASLLTVARSTAVGTPTFRIFQLVPGNTASISGMTITGGDAGGGDGGGIHNTGTLSLTDVAVRGNIAGNNGGGIENN